MIKASWFKPKVLMGDTTAIEGICLVAVYGTNCNRCYANTRERLCDQLKCEPHSEGEGICWIEYNPTKK